MNIKRLNVTCTVHFMNSTQNSASCVTQLFYVWKNFSLGNALKNPDSGITTQLFISDDSASNSVELVNPCPVVVKASFAPTFPGTYSFDTTYPDMQSPGPNPMSPPVQSQGCTIACLCAFVISTTCPWGTTY